MPKKPRVFSRDFKLTLVRRMLAGEKVGALARETTVLRKDLYIWRARYRSGGAEALRGCGRPHRGEGIAAPNKPAAVTAKSSVAELGTARQRIAELERKVGQQQVELDFFQQTLRQVRAARRPSTELGVTEFTESSKR